MVRLYYEKKERRKSNDHNAKIGFLLQNDDRHYLPNQSGWEGCLSRHSVDLKINQVKNEDDAEPPPPPSPPKGTLNPIDRHDRISQPNTESPLEE